MARKNKYRPGKHITRLYELVAAIEAGRWIYLRGRPKHPAFLMGMTLRTLKLLVSAPTSVRYAELNLEPEDDEPEDPDDMIIW